MNETPFLPLLSGPRRRVPFVMKPTEPEPDRSHVEGSAELAHLERVVRRVPALKKRLDELGATVTDGASPPSSGSLPPSSSPSTPASEAAPMAAKKKSKGRVWVDPVKKARAIERLRNPIAGETHARIAKDAGVSTNTVWKWAQNLPPAPRPPKAPKGRPAGKIGDGSSETPTLALLCPGLDAYIDARVKVALARLIQGGTG